MIKIKNEILQYFNQGERKEFFRCWIEYLPGQLLNNESETQKLEFELNIKFAIFPYRNKSVESKEVIII
jgi:hypothetical protein